MITGVSPTELPEPLVSPDNGDLRDYRYMPLHIERLRRSKTWLIAKRQPELGFYMVNLWSAAWHESPVASLEDDDDVLADAALCEAKRWPKVKDKVLHGWVKCSNGRLYHPVVAELANEALETRKKQSKRGLAGAAARWRGHSASIQDECDGNAQAMPGDGNGREGKGIESKGLTPPTPPLRGDRKKRGGEGSADVLPAPPWEARCRSWAKGHRWGADWGPAPGEPGCWAPADIAEQAIEQRKSAANSAAPDA